MGSRNDDAITAEVSRAIGQGSPVTDLAGRTTLDEAIDLLSVAVRVVTNDSGLMHIAAALDRPMAALFGSSSPAFTPPLSAKARVISLRLACSPCFQRTCPLGHTNCLVQLEAARVLTALE
jgi:heptosyltransferase-2